MSDYLIDGKILESISDAIREKTSSPLSIRPENMASEIANIPSGVDPSNLATVDKVGYINAITPTNILYNENDGILASSQYDIFDKTVSQLYGSGTIDFRVPIIAGENVSFEVEGNNVKINATGGNASTITDVTELPTENINTKSFYRILTAKWVCYKEVYNSFTCYYVQTLPEIGEVATTDMATITTYYNGQDGIVYGYVDDMLGTYFGIPSGWYPAEMLFSAAGIEYGGVITDIGDDLDDGAFRVLLESIIYTYTDDKWVSIKGVGSAGIGINAEIFNGKNNQASGDYSHAEGDFTNAKGRNSHTEGECTVATARDQHVQGRYNIEDTEEQYAHIVGNGEDGSPSNAHTLDWNGNAWFQSKVKVGGSGQDDENAKELATVDMVTPKFTVATEGSMTVWDVISKAQEMGANLSEWTPINTIGHIQTVIGVIYQPFGSGSFGLLRAANLMNMNTVAEVSDWSTIPFSDFLDGMFKYPLPYFDESNEGQVLTVVSNMGVLGTAWENAGGGALEMPQIRFAGAIYTNSTKVVNEENPLTLSVELVGGGSLQPGDILQICVRRTYTYMREDGVKYRKKKLRAVHAYEITYDDIGKRFLTIKAESDTIYQWLFKNDRNQPLGIDTLSPFYLRIKRVTKYGSDTMECDAIFSNIVTVWKTYDRQTEVVNIK